MLCRTSNHKNEGRDDFLAHPLDPWGYPSYIQIMTTQQEGTMGAAKDRAAEIAAKLNELADSSDPYDFSAKSWAPAGDKNWARVYFAANSRSRRQLGHLVIAADGTVRGEILKQKSAIKGRLAQIGVEL